MRSTSTRRELAFVLAVAAFGLALVLVVAFAPWYSMATDTTAGSIDLSLAVATLRP